MPSIDIPSPMAGSVKELLVTPGDAVAVTQELLIIESMKMEIPLESECAGTVTEVLVHPSQQIEEGQVLLRLEAD
jgi:acetyl-CoA carboxylase biotin carboxyl carrier protein